MVSGVYGSSSLPQAGTRRLRTAMRSLSDFTGSSSPLLATACVDPRTTAYEASAPTRDDAGQQEHPEHHPAERLGIQSLEPVLPEMGTEEQAGEAGRRHRERAGRHLARPVRTPRAPRSPGRGRSPRSSRGTLPGSAPCSRARSRSVGRSCPCWWTGSRRRSPRPVPVTRVGGRRRPRQSRSANAITTTAMIAVSVRSS